MKKKHNQKYKFDYISLSVTIAIIASVLFLSTGYSAFSATGRIEGIFASVEPSADVKVTSISLYGTTNGGISSSHNYNLELIYGNIILPNADSTVTYKVNVTVFGGAEMKIASTTDTPSNLEFTITGYNIDDTLCNSQEVCNYGATQELYVTVGYKSGAYNSSNTEFSFQEIYNFEQVDRKAKVGSSYFDSLQAAINSVPTNGTQTTVQLLKNTTEAITVSTGQNIILDLNGNTVSNDGSNAVITNDGTVRMISGNITSNAAVGAINNNSGGTFIITGGSIAASGSKQAIYNDGGIVQISGTAQLSNKSNDRATVHNLSNGTMTITGGTITASRFNGVFNAAGTLVIGTKDGNISTSSPDISGGKYGVDSNVNYSYYDGTIKGVTKAFSNEARIADSETGYDIVHTTVSVNGIMYDEAHLGIGVIITFNANGGSVTEATRKIEKDGAIGALPTPTHSNPDMVFDDWWTAATGGTKVTKYTTFSVDTPIYAHWIDINDYCVAEIGNTKYTSIHDAVTAVPNNTLTTITITRDIVLDTRISIPSNKKIIFDLDGNTISNSAVIPLFENNGGTVTITNGTLRSNTTQGAINNNTSTAVMTLHNLNIYATGTRQCLYNDGGTVTISGNSHFTNVSVERGAVQNQKNGTMHIIGGTIEASHYSAIVNVSGRVFLGEEGGGVSTTSPVAIGNDYGIDNSSTFNFYDGILKGKTDAINGNVNNIETNYSITTGVDGAYKTAILTSGI